MCDYDVASLRGARSPASLPAGLCTVAHVSAWTAAKTVKLERRNSQRQLQPNCRGRYVGNALRPFQDSAPRASKCAEAPVPWVLGKPSTLRVFAPAKV